MSNSRFLYVANWKMELSFKQAILFYKKHQNGFARLSDDGEADIIVCPSFEALHPLAELFKTSAVFLGAQDCASHKYGAYTGQVSVQSLSEIGCAYCLVGHSERRNYFFETDKDVAEKVDQLLLVDIQPIICVGETRQDYDVGNSFTAVGKQVSAVCELVQEQKKSAHLIFAYEPVWAVGTNKVTSNEHIENMFEFIYATAFRCSPEVTITLLYGGSVDVQSINQLKQINGLGGFLIGRASRDFQKFEKIVT